MRIGTDPSCSVTLMRIRILLVTLIRILPFTLMRFYVLAFFLNNGSLKKCSNRLIFHTFRRVNCKLMRNRIQLSLWWRSRLALCWECGSESYLSIWCGSGSATKLVLTRRTRQENVDMDSGRLIRGIRKSFFNNKFKGSKLLIRKTNQPRGIFYANTSMKKAEVKTRVNCKIGRTWYRTDTSYHIGRQV